MSILESLLNRGCCNFQDPPAKLVIVSNQITGKFSLVITAKDKHDKNVAMEMRLYNEKDREELMRSINTIMSAFREKLMIQ